MQSKEVLHINMWLPTKCGNCAVQHSC